MSPRLKRIALLLTSAWATGGACGQSLPAIMHNSGFFSVPADTPYLETYLAVPGHVITYRQDDQARWHGCLRIALQVYRDTTLVDQDTYLLYTPSLPDTHQLEFTIVDLRRRFLKPGNYLVALTAADHYDTARIAHLHQGVNLPDRRHQIAFSDILLVQQYEPTQQTNAYSRNGYDLKPLVARYYGSSLNRLTFYCEIYNALPHIKQGDLILNYSVHYAHNHQVAEGLYRFTRQRPARMNVLFAAFDISRLPSGAFYLRVEARDRTNNLLADQLVYFHRYNPSIPTSLHAAPLLSIANTFAEKLPADSLLYFLKSLLPIAEPFEKDHLRVAMKGADTTALRKLFYAFWLSRHPENPALAWNRYYAEVQLVNERFSTATKYGFETDRGRVYLQYGKPNTIEGHPFEAGALPYEIWHYYQLGNQQRNVRFVFCCKELATGDYQLIHSDARGELNDPRWRFQIFQSFREKSNYYNLDEVRFRETFGSQVDRLFDR